VGVGVHPHRPRCCVADPGQGDSSAYRFATKGEYVRILFVVC
jgi:hypothetical protein